jgi:hypothetical protein
MKDLGGAFVMAIGLIVVLWLLPQTYFPPLHPRVDSMTWLDSSSGWLDTTTHIQFDSTSVPWSYMSLNDSCETITIQAPNRKWLKIHLDDSLWYEGDLTGREAASVLQQLLRGNKPTIKGEQYENHDLFPRVRSGVDYRLHRELQRPRSIAEARSGSIQSFGQRFAGQR